MSRVAVPDASIQFLFNTTNTITTMSTTTTSTVETPYLNNASEILPLSVDSSSASPQQKKRQLLQVVSQLCPFMTNHNGSTTKKNTELNVTQLSGGLSNTLFAVKSPYTSKEVLIRLQSPSEDTLVDIQQENTISAWLSRQGKAPIYYGRFQNGRVEEFYSGYTPLKWSDMHLHSKQIAPLLASLHKRVPPSNVLPRSHTGQCWNIIQQWIHLARTQQQQESKSACDGSDAIDLDYLQQELTWLQGQLTCSTENNNNNNHNVVVEYCRQVVFCHMDAQSLNLLKNENNLKLIDYEYACWNPRAADIANTWLEYCDMNNLKADYQSQYPTLQQQEEFLKAYLQAMGDDESTFTKDDYPLLRNEVNRHALISHLQWTAWSLVQSHVSDIEFDYLAYAKQRMQGYELFKKLYFTGNEMNG